MSLKAGRPRKYETEEEAREGTRKRHREYMRAWRAKNKKKGHQQGEPHDVENMGVKGDT